MSLREGSRELLAERACLTEDEAQPPHQLTCALRLGDDHCVYLLWRRSD